MDIDDIDLIDPISHEPFTSENIPRRLSSCSHALSQTSILSLLDYDSLRCPICRKQFNIKECRIDCVRLKQGMIKYENFKSVAQIDKIIYEFIYEVYNL